MGILADSNNIGILSPFSISTPLTNFTQVRMMRLSAEGGKELGLANAFQTQFI